MLRARCACSSPRVAARLSSVPVACTDDLLGVADVRAVTPQVPATCGMTEAGVGATSLAGPIVAVVSNRVGGLMFIDHRNIHLKN